MAGRDPRQQLNLDGYDAPPIPWERVRERLDRGITQAPETGGPHRHTTWLATVDPSGPPHVVPVGAFWDDGSFYFTSGPGTRKSKNLAADAACVLSVATDPFDISIEGRAERVTDADELDRIATIARAGGWPAQVENDALTAPFSAPSAGPPPWYLYRVTAERVYAFGTAEPYGATRFSF
jgi:pyridoxine/pyridoxamine 5'-phosphate oxidase